MRENDLIGFLSMAYQHEEAIWKLLQAIPVSESLKPGQVLFKDIHRPQVLFVHRGILKGFYYDDKGREHVTRFWKENQVILLTNAQRPTITTADHLQAIELARLSALTHASAGPLKLSADQLARFTAKVLLADRNMAELKTHLCALPARQAYVEFQKLFPSNGLPLRDIASYLGITPQTISQIRKNSK